MASFARIPSGVPSLDTLLDNIRLGDNVVVQVTDLEDFRKLARLFARQSVRDKKSVTYIRFASHPPILEPAEGINCHQLDAGQGFEPFTVKVHEIIAQAGPEAYFVFDCLSDLQVAWSTDLMMGNFFCVTCPFLFSLDTVAYFPVLRGHHDYATIARIQATTQLLLDVLSQGDALYLHPIKVWNRYGPEMYLPHKMDAAGAFAPLTSSADLAGYYSLLRLEQAAYAEQNIDSYDRFFRQAKADYAAGKLSPWTLRKISRSMMSHDHQMSELINSELTAEDFFQIKDRVIGSGTIGGKSCGMLLARKMLANALPQYGHLLEPHDSFYVGSDVFYSYLVENDLWQLRLLQRQPENYFTKGGELSRAILGGHFPEAIRDQFKRMLEYFGQIPIIARSSSFLEDGFENAFAGKYESIFCANACGPEERLQNFEDALRRIYASTMDHSALEYRRKRGLDQADEQMAILVQRVSGTRFGPYYMPCAAGVGFSYSVYRWSEELSADAGLLRLVAGLGTMAVDRTGMDYPRLVNLDKPEGTTLVSEADKHRYAQRGVQMIETSSNSLTEVDAYQLIPQLPAWYKNLVCEHDYAAERHCRERGQSRSIEFISCQGIVRVKPLMTLLKEMLATLESRYGTPVDTEYTINFSPDGQFLVNLVQCRPLRVWQAAASRRIPEIPAENILFKVHNSFMGNIDEARVDVVVWIDSRRYHACPYHQKGIYARAVGEINRYYKDSGKTLMLLSPGRIGTSSPDLGVRVTFADISNFSILCEYADPEIGFMPELSFGSHMFLDIVESEMFYTAIMGNKDDTLFRQDFWPTSASVLTLILPELADYGDVVRVYLTDPENPLHLYADLKNPTVICGYFPTDRRRDQD